MPYLEENYDIVVVGAGLQAVRRLWPVQGLGLRRLCLPSVWTALP